jgi:hypothetical protein
MPYFAILESIVVWSPVVRNGCSYLTMVENVQELDLCSGYSHKTMQGHKKREAG